MLNFYHVAVFYLVLLIQGWLNQRKRQRDQMKLNTYKKSGTQCLFHSTRDTINLYMRSQDAYKAIKNLLISPHSKQLKTVFESYDYQAPYRIPPY